MDFYQRFLDSYGSAVVGMSGLVLGCWLAVLVGPVPLWSTPGLVLGIGMMTAVLKLGVVPHAG